MIVCADDYGLRPDIDEAILELCALQKLSAVSCMTLFRRCEPDNLKRLRQTREHIDIGLHLCLTPEAAAGDREKPPALEFPSLRTCLRAGRRGTLRKAEAAAEITAQYETFVQKTGHAPTHIDGHLHIHQLPVIREALLDFVSALPASKRPYVRNTALPLKMLWKNRLPWLKAMAIGLFGRGMRRRLKSHEINTNMGFSGIYDFRRHHRFPDYLPRFVRALNDPKGMLVVHPGKSEPWRLQEFTALRQTQFRVPPATFAADCS